MDFTTKPNIGTEVSLGRNLLKKSSLIRPHLSPIKRNANNLDDSLNSSNGGELNNTLGI